ncbi:hypothetical protein [Pseudomonas sp. GV071]|jgi:hypothetical protein|uniref:hypothetical protein n=1 Tax=Pseudomonas sp. GV071 TaxID=2135754 RepID=UPI000D384503|nr:hypothetical protein [Pseudomonas sp. GV071]PTQ74292.1 hypothetical protein C8K61_101732 [Pseudomonas sp. GV071]
MGNLKDWSEDAAEVARVGQLVAAKAAKRAWSRVLFVAVVGMLVLASYVTYLTYLVSEYSRISDEHTDRYGSLSAENRDRKTIDYLTLCIDATKSGDVNKDYICQQAVALYKDTFIEVPNNGVGENIKRAAYGLMKVEVATKARAIVLARQAGATPGMDPTLKFLLSTTGIVVTMLVALLVMLSTVFATYRLAIRQASMGVENDSNLSPL